MALCTPKRYKFRRFSVQTRLSNCKGIINQSSVSTSVSNAIWDVLHDAWGGRWPESPERIDEVGVPLFLYLNQDEAILYRDMSGVSLHERGYGDSSDKAKSKEGLAAAVLTIAGWNHMVPGFGDANRNPQVQDRVFLDPFCGTGAFLIEAALMACNAAPGLIRRQWPFQVCNFNSLLRFGLCFTSRRQLVRVSCIWRYSLRFSGCNIMRIAFLQRIMIKEPYGLTDSC